MDPVKSKEAMTNVFLPEDIILRIMSKLPVISLMRFTCVSKRWGSMISDPQFTKSHFNLASQQQTLARRRLLLSTDSQMESLELETPSFGDTSSIRKLAFPFKKPGCTIELMGSCNGLVCVHVYPCPQLELYVWNPSNGFVRKLPALYFSSELLSLDNCGFGYVSDTDDYKVMLWPMIGEYFVVTVLDIYSSRANSWKRVEAPRPLIEYRLSFGNGISSNQTLHWFGVTIGSQSGTPDVLAFDLGKEEFRELELPSLDQDERIIGPLGVLSGGCLAVTSTGPSGEFVQLWVMREYNVPESWTKLFKFYIGSQPEMGILGTGIPVSCSESCIVLLLGKADDCDCHLIRIAHRKEKPDDDEVVVCSGHYRFDNIDCSSESFSYVIQYDESLLRLD